MSVFFYGFFILFARFIIYSFIGWLLEVFMSFVRHGKFINRGFFIGPWVPIYGFCAIILVWLFKGETNPIYIFVFSSLIASIIEYLTSVIMEKLFKARWWDYSNYPFNINGRVYLINSIAFGALGCILVEFVNPRLTFFLSHLDPFWFSVMTCIILFVFILDVIISFNIINKIKTTAECVHKDYTEEITKKVKKILYDKSKQFRRIFDAFPDVSVFNKTFKSKKKK